MFILTEKPNVAQQFAEGLGGFKKAKEGWWYNDKGDCIVGAQGHLLTLFMPEDYDARYSKWNMADLPILPDVMHYKLIDTARKSYNCIKKAMTEFDTTDFVLATDADREGELIGGLILRNLNFKNYKTARRFWVSEALESDVVKKGLKEAKPLQSQEFEKLYRMASVRQHADWFVGMNISRYLTMSANTKLTFGRVQTAVLSAVCKRDNDIKAFKSVPYYELECNVIADEKPFSLKLLNADKSEKFNTKSELEEKVKLLKEKDFLDVSEVIKEEKQEEPPLLFNITGLQKYCSVKYGLDPKKTLDLVQELYEKYRCLSYPRTSSQYMGDDNVELVKEKYMQLSRQYVREADGATLQAVEEKKKRIFNSSKVEGHHALIPLAPLPPDAGGDLEKVYDAVLLRFFQVMKGNYVYQSIVLKARKNNLELISRGKVTLRSGWKSGIEETAEDEENEAEQIIPDVKKGDRLYISGNEIEEKKTRPPKNFTDATLLSLMENPRNEDDNKKLVGLGTSATRAAIIEELVKREYIIRTGKKLTSTEKGQFLIDTVNKVPLLAQFIRLDNTTHWEELLEMNSEQFIEGIRKFVRETVTVKLENVKYAEKAKENFGTCPACRKGMVLEGKKGYYCSQYKEGCRFTVWKSIMGAAVSGSDIRKLIKGETTGIKNLTKKDGSKFSAAFKLQDGQIQFVFGEKKKAKK